MSLAFPKAILTLPVLVGVLLAVVFFSFRTKTWDGGFIQAEYQLAFHDEVGKPIEGVQLRVEDDRGLPRYCFPVTDYHPENIPTSDTRGLLVFHHRTTIGELSGECRYFLFVISLDDDKCAPPEFVCRFFYRGREAWGQRRPIKSFITSSANSVLDSATRGGKRGPA